MKPLLFLCFLSYSHSKPGNGSLLGCFKIFYFSMTPIAMRIPVFIHVFSHGILDIFWHWEMHVKPFQKLIYIPDCELKQFCFSPKSCPDEWVWHLILDKKNVQGKDYSLLPTLCWWKIVIFYGTWQSLHCTSERLLCFILLCALTPSIILFNIPESKKYIWEYISLSASPTPNSSDHFHSVIF